MAAPRKAEAGPTNHPGAGTMSGHFSSLSITTEAGPPVIRGRALAEAVIASTVGTTIEWYDFFLYGTAAALVFPALFFPNQPGFLGQVLSFLTFTAGFVARPLGGFVFGYLGDRVGRKSTLMLTLLLMGLSTLLIGLLPTHAQIGGAAPLLLTLLRVVQGIGVGGEWGGAVLLALESGHRGKRGFYASWPQAGVPLGLLASTGAFALARRLVPEPAFSAWGWRLPFFLSGLLIAVGLVIRLRILETPLFRQLQRSNRVAQAPVAETLRRHWREVLLAAGARLSENSCFYLFSAYALTYGKTVLGVEESVVLAAVNVAAAVECFTIPLYGALSDWWSRKAVYTGGCLFLIAFALPYYALLGTREPVWITVATVVALAGGHALLYSVQASLIPELFDTRLRYTGASVGYQLAAPVAGGLSPVVALWLVRTYPGEIWPLAQYVILITVVSLACVQGLAETSRKDLSAADRPGPGGEWGITNSSIPHSPLP
jgi:MFS family permease